MYAHIDEKENIRKSVDVQSVWARLGHGDSRTGVNTARDTLIAASFGIGLFAAGASWAIALSGVSNDSFPGDKIATIGACIAIYTPLLVFLNPAGSAPRPLKVQLAHLARIWFFANCFFQCIWELPWFIMRHRFQSGHVGEKDVWLWPWWAYGVADTRYLSNSSDIPLAISAVDAAISLVEAALVYLYLRKGFTVLFAWVSIPLQCCLGWGQLYFYVEIFHGFRSIQDGWFGLYVKYILMGLPWLFFPFLAAAGYMWYLAEHYQALGASRARQDGNGTSKRVVASSFTFAYDTDLYRKANGDTDGTVYPVLVGMLVYPWAFIACERVLYAISTD